MYGEIGAVDLGGDAPFRIQRTPAVEVSATLIIVGQDGQSSAPGGDVVLGAGTGAGASNRDGSIQMGTVNVHTDIVELAAMMHSYSISIRD